MSDFLYEPGRPLNEAELSNLQGLAGMYQTQEAIQELTTDRRILHIAGNAMIGFSGIWSGASAASTFEVEQVVPEPLASPEAGVVAGGLAIAAGAVAVLLRWKSAQLYTQVANLKRETGI